MGRMKFCFSDSFEGYLSQIQISTFLYMLDISKHVTKEEPFSLNSVNRATLWSIIYETIHLIMLKILELLNQSLLSDRN